MAEEEDDIMDFFDLNKKFEKKCVLKGSSINTNYKLVSELFRIIRIILNLYCMNLI